MTRHNRAAWTSLLASKAFAACVGFFVLLRIARVLGPEAFSGVEYAASVAGVMLVWVRGGVETITHREAARNPKLIAPLSEVLLVTKIGLAALALALIAACGFASRTPQSTVLLVAGLILIPSALCLDVGPRANGDLYAIAAIQTLRTIGLLTTVFLLVSGPRDARLAAGCVVVAETIASIGFGLLHVFKYRAPRPRIRLRAIRVLLARGLVTSLGRFSRVFLYAADLLILGAILGSSGLGPYAAARRIVFAILAVGLVIPSALGPLLAKTWLAGAFETSAALSRVTSLLLGPLIAASLGLILLAPEWMNDLFGSSYRSGGLALALFAARLPLMIISAMTVSALIAIRLENDTLQILSIACVLAVTFVPIVSWIWGPIGAAWSILGIELFIAGAGWRRLAQLGAAPRYPTLDGVDLIGIASLVCVVEVARGRPTWAVALLAAGAFGFARFASKKIERLRPLASVEAAR